MSKPSHTPGPWEIRYKTNGCPDLITAPNESPKEPGNIVDIIRKASFCSPSMAESKANAHLISAAPDLLEVLEKIKAKKDLELPARLWIEIIDAISKAKGVSK